MKRKFLRTHRELLTNATFCLLALVLWVGGYGERQQADESTITAQDGSKTANAAKG